MATWQRLGIFLVLTCAGVLTPLSEAAAGNFTVNFFKKNGTAITTAVNVTIANAVGSLYTNAHTSGQTINFNGSTLPATDKAVTLTFTQGTATSQIIGLHGNSPRTAPQVLNVVLDIP